MDVELEHSYSMNVNILSSNLPANFVGLYCAHKNVVMKTCIKLHDKIILFEENKTMLLCGYTNMWVSWNKFALT